MRRKDQRRGAETAEHTEQSANESIRGGARDGKQFEAGTYTVEIRGDGDGSLTRDIAVDLDPDSDLPPAPLPDDLTGSNGQPVTFDVAGPG